MSRLLFVGLASVLVVCFAGCGGGGDTGLPPASTQASGRVESLVVASQKVGFTYNIDVYLPAGYDTGSTPYPVIYALDGDSRFDGTNTRFDNFREIMRSKGTNAILVGIGGTARRQTDYNFPGATAFHDFLTLELVPLIDARFRTNPGKRILSGISTSGNLAATALFLEAPTQLVFSHFISAEGAFWQQTDTVYTLEEQMFNATKGKNIGATLILALANGAPATNATYVHDLFVRVDARHYAGLKLLETSFPTGHVAADNPSFDDALNKIFQ
jgi:predicted alpha/beta superfamily hydrolase